MNEIQQWIDNPNRDYAAGVSIFARYSSNKGMARTLSKGTARFWMDKLVYEMRKLSKQDHVRENGQAVSKICPSKNVKTAENPIRWDWKNVQHLSRRDAIPEVIMSAKAEISTLYNRIDKAHRELYDLGISNDRSVVAKRKKILDERKPIIVLADTLYRLKEDWFAGDDSVLPKIKEIVSAPIAAHPSVSAPKKATADVSFMSDIELAKRKTQLRSSITKCSNMLTYQSIRKGESPTPLPEGKKRSEYEEKLSALKSEFSVICKEIEKRVKK